MKATFATKAIVRALTGVSALLALTFQAPAIRACTPCYACSPVFHVPLRPAPSLCNTPGFYTWCPNGTCYGAWSGPHYYLRPPGLPFNGMLPGPGGQAISAGRPQPASFNRGPMAGPGPMMGAPGPGMGGPGMGGPGMGGPGPMMGGPGPMPGMGPGPMTGPMAGPGMAYPFPPTPPFPPIPGMPYMNYPAPGAVVLPPGVATPYMGGAPSQNGPSVVFPTHPHVRSPRDFFMHRENMEDRARQDFRPNLIP